MIIFWLFVLAFIIFVVIYLASLWAMVWIRVPFVSTPRPVGKKMLELAKIKPGEKVYELGCGRGRMIIAANKKYGAKAEGIELSLFPYLIARFNVWRTRAKVKLIFGNFLHRDLSDADVILCYLATGANKKLCLKLDKELKRGARVISNGFSMNEWKNSKVEEKMIKCIGRKIYCYKIGE